MRICAGDYRAGYRAVRRILAVGEARGYEPDTSQARFVFAVCAGPGSSPSRTPSGRLSGPGGADRGGDLANAGYTYRAAVHACWTARPRWTSCCRGESTSGLRAPHGQRAGRAIGLTLPWLAGALRGEAPSRTKRAPRAVRGNPPAINVHLTHASLPRSLGDLAGLDRHTAAAMPLLHDDPHLPTVAVARMLRGLALAWQARTAAAADERAHCWPSWTG